MKIKMTADFQVAEDGIHVETWMQGSEHDTNEPTARLLVGISVAEFVDAEVLQVTSADIQQAQDAEEVKNKRGAK